MTQRLLRTRAARLTLIAVVTLAARLPFLHWPLIEDEGAYAYVARWWVAGYTLYGPELWLDRPQGIFAAYLPAVILGGTTWMIRLWGACWVAATAVVVARIAEELAGRRVGLGAGLTFGLLSISPFVEGWTANAEMFMLLPATGAVLALMRSHLMAAGALTSAATLLKPSGIVVALLVPMAIRSRSQAVRWVAGALAAGAPSVVHAVVTVGFSEYLYALAGSRLSARIEGVFEPAPFAGTLLTTPAWLGLAILAVPALRQSPWLLAWLAASLAGVLLGGHYYAHYYVQLLPPLAVAAGIGLGAFLRPVWRLALAAIVLWKVALNGVALAQPAGLFHERDVVAEEVARYVRARTTPEDTVYVAFSAVNILYLTGRRSADRHIFPLNVINVPGALDQLVARIRARQPRYVIDVEGMLRRRRAWHVDREGAFARALEEHYVLEARVATVPIYRARLGRDLAGRR